MEVLVFKTKLRGHEEISKIKSLLSPVKMIQDWNVDFEDSDKILRVVAPCLQPAFIESLLQTSGIYCKELED